MYLHNSVTKTRNCMVKVLFKSTKENRERKMIGKRMHDGGTSLVRMGTPLMPILQLNQSQESQNWKQAKCHATTRQSRGAPCVPPTDCRAGSQAQHFKGESRASKSNVSKLKILLRWWIKSVGCDPNVLLFICLLIHCIYEAPLRTTRGPSLILFRKPM